ncbi:DNA cytosine methyltransferase [Nocardia brasiliensis]|uniref:DNA cytosine methyltransferase n=1 Tax=Nocardia brasiliensis TaxID=37326 RepID=UPI002458D8DA|nr:DNA cytosine methyltransferase [Nocardia brasiliensis]
MSPEVVDPAKVKMVDLFAGPGGLDVAASWLGVPTMGIERDENACATRTAAGLWTEPSDVRDLGPGAYPNAVVLTGGPPCQTFSVAGSGAGRRALDQVLAFIDRMDDGEDVRSDLEQLEDERTGLVLEPLRWILEAIQLQQRYRTVVLEQVPAVLPVWQRYKGVLSARGYDVVAGILRTEEYGVPQTRRRAILIASLDVKAELPTATHQRFRRTNATSDLRAGGLERQADRRDWVSMGEALRQDNKFVVVSNYGTGGDPKARGERRFDEPAYTVTGKVSRNRMMTLDGEYIRHLTIEDASLLQTFPLNYPWSGKDVAQQVGNAIPPRLAAHVLSAAMHGRKPNATALDEAVGSIWNRCEVGEHRMLDND